MKSKNKGAITVVRTAASRAKKTGIGFATALVVLSFSFLSFPGFYDDVGHRLEEVFDFFAKGPSSELTPAIARWFLVAIIINSTSIACAITQVFLKDEKKSPEVFSAIIFGVLIGFHLVSLCLIYSTNFDFKWVALITIGIFWASDVYGMMRSKSNAPGDYHLYRDPFVYLDSPLLTILLALVGLHSFGELPSSDFYHGAGAAVMLLSGASYITLMVFVIK